jgi:hypothetical protein
MKGNDKMSNAKKIVGFILIELSLIALCIFFSVIFPPLVILGAIFF